MKAYLFLAAAAAGLAMPAVANAAVMVTPTDTAPDGSFSFGFAGTQLAPDFSDSFTFTIASGLVGTLSSLIGTSAATATNDVDFTSVLISGGSLATPAALSPLTDEPNETRSLGNGITLGAGTYTYSIRGTTVGQNGSYGGNVSFATASPVPEPATWGLMILGFAGAGYVLRRRQQPSRVRYA